MQPIALAIPVEGDDEDIALDQQIDERFHLGLGQHRPTQGDAEGAQLGEAEEEVAQLAGEGLQHLAIQQRGYVLVGAGKRIQQFARLGRPGQCDLGQPHGGRPAFRLTIDRIHALVADVVLQFLPQQFGDFVLVQAQVAQPQLAHPVFQLGATPVDGRSFGAGPVQRHRWRGIEHQRVQHRVQGAVAAAVEVVDEQGDGRFLARQGGEQIVEPACLAALAMQQGLRPGGHGVLPPTLERQFDGLDHEGCGLGPLVQTDPMATPAQGELMGVELRQQHRFAVTDGGDDAGHLCQSAGVAGEFVEGLGAHRLKQECRWCGGLGPHRHGWRGGGAGGRDHGGRVALFCVALACLRHAHRRFLIRPAADAPRLARRFTPRRPSYQYHPDGWVRRAAHAPIVGAPLVAQTLGHERRCTQIHISKEQCRGRS